MICRPTELSCGLAPMTASERGDKSLSRRYVDICILAAVANCIWSPEDKSSTRHQVSAATWIIYCKRRSVFLDLPQGVTALFMRSKVRSTRMRLLQGTSGRRCPQATSYVSRWVDACAAAAAQCGCPSAPSNPPSTGRRLPQNIGIQMTGDPT